MKSGLLLMEKITVNSKCFHTIRIKSSNFKRRCRNSQKLRNPGVYGFGSKTTISVTTNKEKLDITKVTHIMNYIDIVN